MTMAFIVGGVLFALIVYNVYSNDRKSKKQKIKAITERDEWLKEHLLKPRYQVLIVTQNGGVHRSEIFEPQAEVIYGYFGWEVESESSHDRARGLIKVIFHNNRYWDREDHVIPLSSINYVEIVEVK